MPENQTSTTELTSQYIAQVTSDLERNTKEQERIAADISTLQEQLLALQHDQTVLVNMHEALGGGRADVAGTTRTAPSVPSQASGRTKRSAQPTRSKRSKESTQPTQPKQAPEAAQRKKATAAATKKATAKKSATAAQPSLVDLIRTHLEEQKEPRSAAEITTALTAAHPDRSIKTTVVRTTLENLVARSSAHRNKQGTSVFYTATDDSAAEPRAAAATA